MEWKPNQVEQNPCDFVACAWKQPDTFSKPQARSPTTFIQTQTHTPLFSPTNLAQLNSSRMAQHTVWPVCIKRPSHVAHYAPHSPRHVIETSFLVYCWGGLTWENSLRWLFKPCGSAVRERDHLRESECRLCMVLPINVLTVCDWPSRLIGHKTEPLIAPHLPVSFTKYSGGEHF